MIGGPPRTPDPTLTEFVGTVAVHYRKFGNPPLAHRIGQSFPWRRYARAACRGQGPVTLTNAEYARWFAVPCREPGCFPDAPEPGRYPCDCRNRGCSGSYSTALLDWQVPA